MDLAICTLLAYALLGIAQVGIDLDSRRGNPLRAVRWTLEPTLPRMLLVGLFWIARSFQQQFRQCPGQTARPLVRGFLFIAAPMSAVTLLNWVCIATSRSCSDSSIGIITLSAILIVVGNAVLLPFISLLMLVPLAIIDGALNVVLPPGPTFEERGLRLLESMPASQTNATMRLWVSQRLLEIEAELRDPSVDRKRRRALRRERRDMETLLD